MIWTIVSSITAFWLCALMLMFVYLEGYLSCKPISVIVIGSNHDDEILLEYPDIKNLYDQAVHLETKIVHQEWNWNKSYRSKDPVRAFGYRFIYPWLWKKKLQKRDNAWSEYQLSVKLVKDY